jgi:hypothetical protein
MKTRKIIKRAEKKASEKKEKSSHKNFAPRDFLWQGLSCWVEK